MHNDFLIVRKILWFFLNDSCQGKSSWFFLQKPTRNYEFESNRLKQMIYDFGRFFLTQETERQTPPFGKWFVNRKKNDVKEKSN